MHTELGRSQVQVPVHTGLGKSAKSLAKRVGKELGEELARRKWRSKLMQTWSRRN